MREEVKSPAFPPGLDNAFLFAVFNALSFPLIISTPMILYAKTIGASATVLGIVTGLTPTLVIFQIPAAKHVDRIGYKEFVYAGWGTRVMFIFVVALIPILGFLNATTRLALLLALLFIFNLSRGISSCGWLPWITTLVPAEMRGRYLAGDAACSNLGSFIIIVVAAFLLGDFPAPWQFSVLFVISALMGAASLVFLKRIPDVPTPKSTIQSGEPVPWLAISRHPPFRKLLHLNIAWALAYGGLIPFTTSWLKSDAGLSEKNVLLVTSVSFLGGLSALWLIGSRADHIGSKPVMTFSMLLWVTVTALWFTLAAHIFAPMLWLVLTLQVLMGLGLSLVTMSNLRLAMGVIPVMGRNHFFALFSVVQNLVLGLSPVIWGIAIDALRGTQIVTHGIEFNRYSLYFLAMMLIYIAGLLLTKRLHEPGAASFEELIKELLVQSPHRIWVRLRPW